MEINIFASNSFSIVKTEPREAPRASLKVKAAAENPFSSKNGQLLRQPNVFIYFTFPEHLFGMRLRGCVSRAKN